MAVTIKINLTPEMLKPGGKENLLRNGDDREKVWKEKAEGK